jgi:hypothetical protein
MATAEPETLNGKPRLALPFIHQRSKTQNLELRTPLGGRIVYRPVFFSHAYCCWQEFLQD